MSKYRKGADPETFASPSDAEGQVSLAIQTTGKTLHQALREFCVWFVKRGRGAATHAVGWLAGCEADHTPNVLSIRAERSTTADIIEQRLGRDIREWAGQKTVRFDYTTPVNLPACGTLRAELDRRLNRGGWGPVTCTCYSCQRITDQNRQEAA